MAKFGAYDIETPQEVLARLDAQRAPALASNDLRTRNTAMFGKFFQDTFGNPELDKAKERETAATAAFSGLTKDEGEDDLDFRKRQNQTFFDKMKTVDPSLAAQAAEELTAIQNEQLERSMLMSAESRRESNEARLAAQEGRNAAKGEVTQALNDIQYAVSADGTTTAFNLSDPQSKAAWMKAAKDPNNTMLTREEMVAADADKAKEGETKLFNNSSFSKKLDIVEAKSDAAARQERFLEIISTDFSSRTQVSKALGMINKLGVEWGAFEDKASDLTDGTYESKWRKQIQDNGGITQAARNRGVTDSLILDLAYTMARAKDPGGRLSDMDVQAAQKMLGAEQSDPSIIARTFLEQMEPSIQSQLEAFESLGEAEGFLESTQGKILSREHERLMEKRDALRERSRMFFPEAEYNNLIYGTPMPDQGLAPVPSSSSTQNSAGSGGFTIVGVE